MLIEGIRPSSIVKIVKGNTIIIGMVLFICSKKDKQCLVVIDKRGNFYEADAADCVLHRAGCGITYRDVNGKLVGEYGIYAY